VDLLDFEPYVAGQYPHLVQAVQWAQEMDFTVMIDIHGAPGSQNGWEETGLVGPILFTANQSNTDRTLNVLKNLTTEFTKEQYGGVVTNIELMNEPIFADNLLREFYTAGANVVGKAADQGVNTTIHDAFYNPPKWKNYDPNNMDAQSPAPHITVDTHQFWAFPPLDTLTEPQILQHICDFATALKAPDSNIPPTLVGEWSLSTGITANSSTQSADDRNKRTWFRTVFEAQNAAYAPNAAGQSAIGWYFWSWKTEYDIDAWSYRKGVQQGYIPANISDPSTYAFPIGEDGCIDASHKYTAPATVTTSTQGGSSPTSSGGSSSGGSSSSGDSQSTESASPSKKSDAPAVRGGLTATLALVVAIAFGMCIGASA